MIVVVDNDVLQALASWDLLHELPALFNVSAADLRVLDTARFRYHVKDPQKGQQKFGDAWQRIASFLSTTPTITAANPEDMEAAVNVLNFDEGELMLFSYVSRAADAIVVTGDKRAIEALAQAPTLQAMRQRLLGRVVCLEQVLQLLFERRGFEAVRDAVVASSTKHITARVIFGSGLATTHAAANDALAHYIGQLRQIASDLLREHLVDDSS